MIRAAIDPSEYHEYYAHYLNLVPEQANFKNILQSSKEDSIAFIEAIDKPLNFAYASDKLSIAHVILHNIDTERVFTYRALRFIRGDQTALPGFDQDVFARDYDNYAFAKADLIKSFVTTRNATIELFNGVSDKHLLRKGVASNNTMSVRVIPFLIAGHTKHHENVIKERYL